MAGNSITISLAILASVFVIDPSPSFACSPMANTPAKFDAASHSGKHRIAPNAPVVYVESITRGGDRKDSCSDIGRIVLLIAPAPAAYAYRFKVIDGKDPSGSFNDKAVIGYDSSGKQTFQFSWLEAGKAPPLDFKVRVTAYSKSGRKGAFRIIHIHDNGRQ